MIEEMVQDGAGRMFPRRTVSQRHRLTGGVVQSLSWNDFRTQLVCPQSRRSDQRLSSQGCERALSDSLALSDC